MAHGPLVCRKDALISASCLRVEGENTCYLYFVSLVLLSSFLISNSKLGQQTLQLYV